jgi:hypothetical protein
MHPKMRQLSAGKCSECGMLPEGTRFGLIRHMLSSPFHIAVMVAVMVAIMLAAMMLVH